MSLPARGASLLLVEASTNPRIGAKSAV